MCVKDSDQLVGQEIENLDDNNNHNNNMPQPLHYEVLHTQIEKCDEESPVMSSPDGINLERSFPVRFLFLHRLVLLGLSQFCIFFFCLFEHPLLVETGFCHLCICFLM